MTFMLFVGRTEVRSTVFVNTTMMYSVGQPLSLKSIIPEVFYRVCFLKHMDSCIEYFGMTSQHFIYQVKVVGVQVVNDY